MTTLVVALAVVLGGAPGAWAADRGTPFVTCALAKRKAAEKQAGGKLTGVGKAVKRHVEVDPACLAKAELKFQVGFAKAELEADCVTTGDTATVEAAVDQCMSEILDAVPATPPSPCGDAEASDMVGVTFWHNRVRSTVDPPADPGLNDLWYDSTMAASAQAWADGCSYGHSATAYGENLYAYAGPTPSEPHLDAVDGWASEAEDYDYVTNGCRVGAICVHYTQIVWDDWVGQRPY